MNLCRWLCGFFFFVVLAFLPQRGIASWPPEITVGLSQGVFEVRLAATDGALHVYADTDQAPILEVLSWKELDIRMQQAQFLVNGQEIKGERLLIRSDAVGFVKINDAPYRGSVTLLKKNGITVINNVLVEDYLYGVIPKEMPPTWSAEALQAQSVAARTFALKNRKRHSTDGFDLCNTSHCQVYEGMAAETRTTTDAVNHTRGEVLFYNGSVIDALFHTDSGGMTEFSEYVWGSSVPYLCAVSDLQTQTQPWIRAIPMSEFMQKVEQNGTVLGTLKEIHLSSLVVGKGSGDRSPSGRVRSAELIGTKGRIVLSGNNLRTFFSLPSTLFDMRVGRTDVVFSGYGSGHGLGLSQWGAKALAEKGSSYKDILFHYYTGVTLEKLY